MFHFSQSSPSVQIWCIAFNEVLYRQDSSSPSLPSVVWKSWRLGFFLSLRTKSGLKSAGAATEWRAHSFNLCINSYSRFSEQYFCFVCFWVSMKLKNYARYLQALGCLLRKKPPALYLTSTNQDIWHLWLTATKYSGNRAEWCNAHSCIATQRVCLFLPRDRLFSLYLSFMTAILWQVTHGVYAKVQKA